jgi:hypothetical protein
MNKALLVTAALVLAPLPALSQAASRSDDRESTDRRDVDIERALREFGDDTRGGGPRRGGAFLLRSGDATIAVRCDPRESMRSCVDATLTLLEKARALAPSGTPSAPR